MTIPFDLKKIDDQHLLEKFQSRFISNDVTQRRTKFTMVDEKLKANKFPDTKEIKQLRNSLGLTQAVLAKRSGVSQSTLTKIERGKIKGSYPEVVRLLETLDEETEKRATKVRLKDISTKKIVGVQVDEQVKNVSELMRELDISQLPVFEGERPVGSISDRRILDQIMNGAKMEELNFESVGSIMHDPFPIINEDVDKDSVESLIRSEHAVLTTKNGKITGIVTAADLVQIDWVI